jgi:hypothetical protein
VALNVDDISGGDLMLQVSAGLRGVVSQRQWTRHSLRQGCGEEFGAHPESSRLRETLAILPGVLGDGH